MRWAATLAVVVSSACLGAEPSEAISFDRPIRVINEKNEVRWASDGGTCLTPPAWLKVDAEYKRLQDVEARHKLEPSRGAWFLGGLVAGVAIGGGVALAVHVVTK